MKVFKTVNPKPDFVQQEHEMWDYWKERDVLNKYLHRNDGADKKWFFLDGPITANNPMGVHHAWGRTLKDFYQRYHNMNGYEERFQNGFDCQGLWVEVEVEKELGFKTKKDIETYGIDKFVEKCKERVRKYSGVQTEQSKRLGYFMNWDNSYFTMNDENNYMIWHFLKVCHEKGWLYKGWDSVPWCPRCGTAISQHEILTEEYKDLTHQSVFVKFKLKSEKFNGTSLLVWTTTPWTLPANVAVAIHPELKYALYRDSEGQGYVFIDESEVEDRTFLDKYIEVKNLKKEKDFLGSELVGLEYEGLFDELEGVEKAKEENSNKFHTVLEFKDLVNPNEGTGLVHIAPGCGKEDYDLSKEENIAQILPISSEANYVDGFGELSGKNVKETNEFIFNSLKEKGYLFKVQDYTHRYPTCWRCKTELVFRLVEEWYIAMDKKDPKDEKGRTLREEMIDVAKQIEWIPAFGLDREIDWLQNMHDWLISKKRYWGLALPIWVCKDCGEIHVVGGKKELEEKAEKGWENFKGNSPHRPWVDEVKLKCEKCDGEATRIKDVGNPWLDAGIVPYSTLIDPKTKEMSYISSGQEYWKKWFPADLVLECFPGQFKNWFYAMIAMSTVLEVTNPYKKLLGYALVKDEHGEEMHKSKGNAIWFDDAVEKIGADVMRWMYFLQPTTVNMKFGFNLADETRRRFHLLIWNIYNFFVTYAQLDEMTEPKKDFDFEKVKLSVLDKWVLERLNQTISVCTNYIEKYQAYLAAQEIDNFVQDLSTWYLRRSRKRVGPAVLDMEDKRAFYETMHFVLVTLMKLIAPFNPYFTDQIYQNLTGFESVHLTDWPKVNEELNFGLTEKMNLVRAIVEKGHATRKEKNLKVRQPLQKLEYQVKGGDLEEMFLELIKEELNVKEVFYKDSEKEELEVVLDLNLTDELREEGLMREIVRFIQGMRKELGCKFDDQIRVYYQGSEKVLGVMQKFESEIKKLVIADFLVLEKKEVSLEKEKKVEGEEVWLGVEIVG